MNDTQPLADLARYLESQISANAVPSPPPGPLVSALFERQLALNPAFAAWLKQSGRPANRVESLADIPAVPVAAFKELELTTVPPQSRTVVFHSSGTTGRTPGRHFHSPETLAIYELASMSWFRRRVLGDLGTNADTAATSFPHPPRMISLTPPREAAPNSSLAYMIRTLIGSYGRPDSLFCGMADEGGWRIDPATALAALEQAQAEHQPVVLFGTAFNFVHLLDLLAGSDRRFVLPAGSRVMETGGYKGRSRVVPKEELHDVLAGRLGIAPDHVVSEYGMSELSSQAYDRDYGAARPAGIGRLMQFPPWCHTRVISVETGRIAAPGEPGLLRVVDLANVASVLAIQTEDLAVLRDDGFELLGRAEQAEPRGCSLMTVNG